MDPANIVDFHLYLKERHCREKRSAVRGREGPSRLWITLLASGLFLVSAFSASSRTLNQYKIVAPSQSSLTESTLNYSDRNDGLLPPQTFLKFHYRHPFLPHLLGLSLPHDLSFLVSCVSCVCKHSQQVTVTGCSPLFLVKKCAYCGCR